MNPFELYKICSCFVFLVWMSDQNRKIFSLLVNERTLQGFSHHKDSKTEENEDTFLILCMPFELCSIIFQIEFEIIIPMKNQINQSNQC